MQNFCPVPEFSGDTPDTVLEFIAAIDALQLMQGLDNCQAATVAQAKLKATARAWFTNATSRGEPPNLNRWNPEPEVIANEVANPPVVAVAARPGGLKAALQEYFPPVRDQRAAAQRMSQNKQRQGENHRAFHNRVEANVFAHERATYADADIGPEAAGRELYMKMHDSAVISAVINGLRPAPKAFLDAQDPEVCESIKTLTKKMSEFETSDAGQRDLRSGSAQQQRPAATVSACSLLAQPEQGPSPGVAVVAATTAQPRGPGKGGRAPYVNEDCGYCGIHGHIKAECFKRKADVRKGVIRERHENYPCRSFRQNKKNQGNKDSKGGGAAKPPPPPATGGNYNAGYLAGLSAGGAPHAPALQQPQLLPWQYAQLLAMQAGSPAAAPVNMQPPSNLQLEYVPPSEYNHFEGGAGQR